MKLTESQLIRMIGRVVKSVLSEGYQDKQPRTQSKEEHDEWVSRKSASKKAYYDSKRKESGEEGDSKDGAIDHYDYKHGKGNFPVMTKESKVRMSESEFQKFITESVKRTINKMLTEHETWEPYGSPENEPLEDFLDETELGYDMDNFSGRWNRGPRYDILVDGDIYYRDVPEESVDRLCADLERQGYENIQAQEL